MSERGSPGRKRFSDKEVAAILQRAAELAAVEQKTGGGSTLDELERIAAEAGLDPALIRRAAADVSSGHASTSLGEAVAGGPVRVVYEVEVDGEIGSAAHEQLVAAVQRSVGAPGQMSSAGRAFVWQTLGQNRSLVASVTPRGGRTTIRVEERLGALAGGVFGGVGGGVGGGVTPFVAMGGAALFGPVGAVVGGAAFLVATYLGTRTLFGRLARGRREAVHRLGEELRHVVEEALAGAAVEAAPDASAAALDDALAAARVRHGVAPAASAKPDEVQRPHEVAAQAQKQPK